MSNSASSTRAWNGSAQSSSSSFSSHGSSNSSRSSNGGYPPYQPTAGGQQRRSPSSTHRISMYLTDPIQAQPPSRMHWVIEDRPGSEAARRIQAQLDELEEMMSRYGR